MWRVGREGGRLYVEGWEGGVDLSGGMGDGL